MKYMTQARKFGAKVVQKSVEVGVVFVGVVGLARADMDFSAIGAAVSIGTVSAAIIAMGAIKILPNVAKWATNKLANFF